MPEAREEKSLVVDALVLEALPGALYRLELETESRPRVTAHVGGGSLLRVLPGEKVVVELMPYDTTRARIVRKRT